MEICNRNFIIYSLNHIDLIFYGGVVTCWNDMLPGLCPWLQIINISIVLLKNTQLLWITWKSDRKFWKLGLLCMTSPLPTDAAVMFFWTLTQRRWNQMAAFMSVLWVSWQMMNCVEILPLKCISCVWAFSHAQWLRTREPQEETPSSFISFTFRKGEG